MLRSCFHSYDLEISIKASRRYHENRQEINIYWYNDEAPYEAFNLTHVLEWLIDGYFTLIKMFVYSDILCYLNEIYITNVSVPVAGLNDSHIVRELTRVPMHPHPTPHTHPHPNPHPKPTPTPIPPSIPTPPHDPPLVVPIISGDSQESF